MASDAVAVGVGFGTTKTATPFAAIARSAAMTSPKTVLHVINVGGPGGAETVCVNLARGLNSGPWRSIAVVPNRGWTYRAMIDGGVETVVIDDMSLSALPRYLYALSNVVRKYDVHLIHCHLFGVTVVGALLGMFHHVPVVGTVHGEGDLRANESLRRLKFALINRGLCRLVFVSEPLRQSFLRTTLLRGDITAVIPNGIDVRAYDSQGNETFRREYGVADDEFLVGAVGNFRVAKGYDVFLRSAAILAASEPGYRFVLVGQHDNDLAKSLAHLRDELGLSQRVAFVGFRSDVPAVLSSFDLYALTSRSEGFSIAVVEAMASRLPIVATRCGGPEQILEDGATGILVANESPEDVARAITLLRANADERRRLGNAARSAVEAHFTVAAQIHAYATLYEECVGRGPGHFMSTEES